MIIREATEQDNIALLQLTKLCPMDGIIKLLIDREPDFFSLLKLKGDYKVFVAEKKSKIIGMITLITKHSYIDNKIEEVAYLCDLKINPDYRNKLLAYQLMTCVQNLLKSISVKYCFCLVAKGNQLVLKLFEGRAGIPMAIQAAEFSVYQFLPLKNEIQSEYVILHFNENNKQQAIRLLNTYYQQYQFASLFEAEDDITGDIAWAIYDKGKLCAFLSCIDTRPYKQNVVMGIPVYLKIVLRVIKIFWPYLNFPAEGDVVKMIYIKYLAFEPQYLKAALALVQQARNYAYQKKYTFLSYGVDNRNQLNSVFKSIPKVSFRSRGYLFNLSNKKWNYNSLCHDNFYQV